MFSSNSLYAWIGDKICAFLLGKGENFQQAWTPGKEHDYRLHEIWKNMNNK